MIIPSRPRRAVNAAVTVLLSMAIMAAVAAKGPAATADTIANVAGKNPEGPVLRRVLALYNGDVEETPADTRIHRFAELPLNHLGLVVDFHDVRLGLPLPRTMARYRGVLTWFHRTVPDPPSYLAWAAEVARSGVRVVVLGEIGGDIWGRDRAAARQLFGLLGLDVTGRSVAITTSARALQKDEAFVEFERPLDPILPPFLVLEPRSGDGYTALEVEAEQRGAKVRSALVHFNERGGYVARGYALYFSANDATDAIVPLRVRWILNPFTFFSKAFGLDLAPVPDVTTVSGRRLYFSHVDGDGLNNMAQFPPYNDPPTTSVEVMLKELIEPFPDLPVTFGLVMADIDGELLGRPESADAVRRIFAQPQVEVGSHTYTHPFTWGFFRNYDRQKELALTDAETVPGQEREVASRLLARLVAGRTAEVAEKRRRYLPDTPGMPRANMLRPFDVEMEVGEGRRLVESLAPAGKELKLYQWSGDTRPYEAFVAETRKQGLRNINGGDSRFDIDYPSIAYVAPIGRQVGVQRQIYAVNSNENTYTNLWLGPFHGFRRLTMTLDNTELPRRLKGFNLYYHTYSAEKKVSLEVVRSHLELARRSRLAPIPASRYAAIADGFYSAEIERRGPMTWAIRNRDGLQTVRFDDAGALYVDFARSSGVIGQNRHGGSVYVALDEDAAEAVVALARIDKSGKAVLKSSPHLVESRWLVRNFAYEVGKATTLRFVASGFGRGDFVWAGMAGAERSSGDEPGAECSVAVSRDGKSIWRGSTRIENDGRVAFTIDARAIEPLEATVTCGVGNGE